MCDEADAAGIVFVAGVKKTLFSREARREFTRIGSRARICCCKLVNTRGWRLLRHRLPSCQSPQAGGFSSRAVP
jgi:hypothetical protein